jgi:hypothetical protein
MIKVQKLMQKSLLLLFGFFNFHACERKGHSQPVVSRVSHFVDVSDDIDGFLALLVQLTFNGFYFLVSDVCSEVDQDGFQLMRI